MDDPIDLFSGAHPLPQLVLRWDDLLHNIRVLHGYVHARGADIAPHGKSTMSPAIFRAQLDGGAWAMSVATARQALVARAAGAQRILIANQVLDAGSLETVVDLVEGGRVEVLLLVDSVTGVEALAEAVERRGGSRRPQVLVELGMAGGRTGARDQAAFEHVLDAVDEASRWIELRGVEGYEGIIGGQPDQQLADVDAYLDRLAGVAQAVRDRIGHADPVLSAGGSMFFDRVLAQLGRDRLPGYRLVLRSGGYVSHDSALYRRSSPLSADNPRYAGGETLRPALEAWAVVLSRPEPDLAILGLGFRDAPGRIDLPVPFAVRPRDGGDLRDATAARVRSMNDHHAYVDLGGVEAAVGDLIGMGISHPCEAFEKWRTLLTIDADRRVTGSIHTEF